MPNQALAQKHCVPCKGDTPSFKGDALKPYAAQVPRWTILHEHHLERGFKFPDFRSALSFVNQVGEVAEAEGHHPEIELGWGRVVVRIFSHRVDGLTESDFILAAKIDALSSHVSESQTN